MGLFDWIKGKKEEPINPADLAPPPPTVADIEQALRQAQTMTREKNAPTPVVARVARVSSIVRALMPRIDQLGMQSLDAYTVVATATDYLPESLAGYLGLPRDWANSRPVANGKSSLVLLIDQLDLLIVSLGRMFDAANRQDAGALIAQGEFLAEIFGASHTGGAVIDAGPVPSTNPLDLGAI